MGGSGSKEPKIVYKKKDRSKEVREQEERETRERLEAEQRQYEEEIKDRRRVLKDQCDQERKYLQGYEFGNELGQPNFSRLNVQGLMNSADGIRIAMMGMTGVGKSCFINTCEMAIGPKSKGTAKVQPTGEEGTVWLEEFLYDCNVRFRLIDTRGFHTLNDGELFAMQRILYGHTDFAEDIKFVDEKQMEMEPAEIEECIHALIMVMKANDPRFTNGTYTQQYTEVRNFLKPRGMTPVTVITHADQIPSNHTHDSLIQIASAVTGSPRDHVFFITNYTPGAPGAPGDPKVNYERNMQVFSIIKKTLQKAERYIKLVKQNELNREKERARNRMAGLNISSNMPRGMTCQQFLNEEGTINNWREEDIGKVLGLLQQNDIYLISDLRDPDIWQSVQSRIPLGMKKKIKSALDMS